MHAFDPEVVDVIWRTVEPLLPQQVETHPLGCHRPRVPGRVCFRRILIRLVTGASWVDIEAILDRQVSDTTLRARRDEWIELGVFDALKTEALAAFDRIVGLDLDDVAVDGSLHKGPPMAARAPAPQPHRSRQAGLEVVCGLRTPRHPAGLGDRRRPPQRRAPAGAHLDTIDQAGLLADIGVLHLDRSYDSPAVRDRLRVAGIDQFEIQRRGTKVPGVKRQPLRLGLRWVVEATNTWWSNYGQLRRNTDRRPRHRHAALCLATAILIVGRLTDWRNRWSPR
jgi:transposase